LKELLAKLTADAKREKRTILIISLVTFILQLVTLRPAVVIGEPLFIAQNILNGLGFSYPYPGETVPTLTCYIPPLYVYLIVGILGLGGTKVAIQIVNLLFLQAAAYVLYKFVKRFATSSVAVLSHALLLLYIPLWTLAAAIDPNTLNLLLIALTLDRLYQIYQEPLRKHWLWLGVLVGVQVLVRPDMLVGMVFFAAWLVIVLRKKVTTREIVRSLAISAVSTLVIVLPWTVRNYMNFGKFILVSANSGYNLYLGNNPSASGGFEQNVDANFERESKVFAEFAKTHSQVEQDQYLFHRAVDWALNNPGELVTLDLKKIYFHWWRRNSSGNMLQIGALIYLYDVATALLLFFGFWGFWKLRNRELKLLLVALFLYSTTVSMVFFTQSRHRAIKVDPFLLPLVASTLIALAESRSQKKGRAKELRYHHEKISVATSFQSVEEYQS